VRPSAFAVLRSTSVFRLSELLTIRKDVCRPQPVGLRGYSLGRRPAKYDLIHLTEEYAS
jgi:hypothetical protein